VPTVESRPLIARGSLAVWEREQRARLAVIEEEQEIARMQVELVKARAQLAEAQAERELLRQSLAAAQQVLLDLRGSRGYRLIRRLGRWQSMDRGLRRVLR